MSSDKMLPLPGAVIVDRHIPTGVVMYANTPDQIRAYARAYAAEQTRELVEALIARAEVDAAYVKLAALSGQDSDSYERLLQAIEDAEERAIDLARDAIAKHKDSKQ